MTYIKKIKKKSALLLKKKLGFASKKKYGFAVKPDFIGKNNGVLPQKNKIFGWALSPENSFAVTIRFESNGELVFKGEAPKRKGVK